MILLGFDFWSDTGDLILFCENMALLAVCHVLLWVFVRLLQGPGSAAADYNKIWFPLHAIGNAYVVWAGMPDLIHVLFSPQQSLTKDQGLMGRTHGMVMAIHVYHTFAFPLTMEDRIHHGVSAGVVGSMAYLFRWGRLIDAMNMFVCGIPGGIDYVLLALVKFNVIKKITEKRINMWLQIGIRWPGIFLILYASIVSKVHLGDSISIGWVPIFTVMLLHGFNGIYYAQKVTGNTHLAEQAIKDERKKDKQS